MKNSIFDITNYCSTATSNTTVKHSENLLLINIIFIVISHLHFTSDLPHMHGQLVLVQVILPQDSSQKCPIG